ncbi:MAG: 16S rRNA (cytosine(967)-C(5))-methyltransferase RsmB [Clostridia bacterium]|nr:16S rRNA (cytosine(967)-C(5))-methyltransferase RsmB [Clostridia bacterium]
MNAYTCLDTIYRQGAYSEIALNNILLTCAVKDKALTTKIVYGVLDNDTRLDYIIGLFAKSVKPIVKIILKIGIYCLQNLSIPVYAVINDCAELTKTSGKMQLVGFVNATLRAISRSIADNSITYPKDKLKYLSVYYSFPYFAVTMLVKQYGYEMTKNILAYQFDNKQHIRINLSKISKTDFCTILDDKCVIYDNSPLDDCLYCRGSLMGIDTTYYTNMALGSCYVVHALNSTCDCSVLDVCSAPGGKAVYIKQLNPSATVTACDIHPHRVELIKSYARRMGVVINTAVADATKYEQQYELQFDYCLCDVPCSGLGVFYSKPDIKLNRTKEQLADIVKIQSSILSNASKYCKVGGYLLYSTCSIMQVENQQVIADFLAHNINYTTAPITGLGLQEYQKQFLPPIDNTEGYYVALLKRIA